MAESCSVTSGNVTESKDTDCGIIVSPWNSGRLLFTCLNSLLGADDVSGESWQIAAAFHHGGDDLTLCADMHKGYDCTHPCRSSFGFAWTDGTVTFRVFVVEFSLQSQRYDTFWLTCS
jgi:hypothetical protein